MWKMLILLAFLLFSFELVYCVNPEPVDSYTNRAILEQPDLYYLYWKHDNVDITFEIHYKNTRKWVLFGFQSNDYSDLIAGWVNDDGTGHFSDRKLSNQNVLSFDSNQDWTILDAFNKDDYKILIFSRKIKQLCNTNSPEDLDIQNGVTRIAYASGLSANQNDGTISDFTSIKTNSSISILNTNGPFNCQQRQAPQMFTSTPTGTYTSYLDLMENGMYRFYWNFTSTDLIGEIHVRTTGWVAFGLSPNGGMDNSDAIVGWIDDKTGAANFTVNNVFLCH
jgi:hypothetical protein